jgi:hypothetical protein
MIGETMPDSFDPYAEWLGIQGGEQPPDHYRLLGLRRFESDPAVIGRAADQALARVGRAGPGLHLPEWNQLVGLLVATKACLLSPSDKASYDAELQARAPAGPILQAAANPTAQHSLTGPIVAGALLVVLGIGGVLLNAVLKSGPPVKSDLLVAPRKAVQPPAPPTAPTAKAAPVAQPKVVASKTVAVPPTTRPLQPTSTAHSPKSSPQQPAQPSAVKPASKPTQPSVPVDAEKAEIFGRAAADARAALAARNMPTAETHLKTAVANAQTPDDRNEVDRLGTLLENLTQFWNGIGEAMAKLRPADEIVLKDSRLIVIESRGDYLEVKTGGQKHSYRLETLPTPLVLAIVEQTFGKDPGSKAIIASFLAVDPQGDRALAKRYWQEAAQAGFDCEKLILECDERLGR